MLIILAARDSHDLFLIVIRFDNAEKFPALAIWPVSKTTNIRPLSQSTGRDFYWHEATLINRFCTVCVDTVDRK